MRSNWYDAYERGRPGYPPEVASVVPHPRATRVVDLAAGTGKLTRRLISHFPNVIAVEPDDEMRRRLVATCPEADVLAGSAEHIPLADGSVDAVFAAQCFHLFDRERALAELARVLRSGGTLVLLWNVQAGQPEPRLTSVDQLLGRHWPKGWDPLDLGDPVPVAPDEWQRAFRDAAFDPFHHERLPNQQTADREELVAFIHSMGWIASLPDEERSSLLEKVRTLLTSDRYALPWETRVYWARLAKSPGLQ